MSTQLIEHKTGPNRAARFFGLFSANAPSGVQESRSLDETILLLKRAQKTIEKAERIIIQQNNRIDALEDQETVDALTGFLNKRGFEKAFLRERARLERQKARSALIILVEMENFDHIKSKHGIRAVESCLQMMSHVLRDEMHEYDSVARISKTEFALLFASSATDKALDRTQKLSIKLNNLSLLHGALDIPISASIRLQDFNEHTEFTNIF